MQELFMKATGAEEHQMKTSQETQHKNIMHFSECISLAHQLHIVPNGNQNKHIVHEGMNLRLYTYACR